MDGGKEESQEYYPSLLFNVENVVQKNTTGAMSQKMLVIGHVASVSLFRKVEGRDESGAERGAMGRSTLSGEHHHSTVFTKIRCVEKHAHGWTRLSKRDHREWSTSASIFPARSIPFL